MTASTSQAAVKTWTNGALTNNKLKWINPSNWDSSPQPTVADTTIFTGSVLVPNTTVTIGSNATATGKSGEIQFDGAPTFTVGASTDPYGLSLGGLSYGNGGYIGLIRTTTAWTAGTTSTNTQTIYSSIALGNTVAFQIADQSGGSAGPGAVVITGAISDGTSTYGITKTGAGQLQLAGANTYKGATTVLAGTLIVNGTNSGPGAFVVGDGTNAAVLGGSGTIAGAVTIASNATLAPGNLITSSLALADASNLNFDLDQANAPGITGGNDLITVNGDLTLDGTLNVAAGADFGAGTYELFAYTGSLTDHLLTLETLPAGLSGSIDTSSPGVVNLVITAVPEPAMTVLAGVVGLLGVRRRSRVAF